MAEVGRVAVTEPFSDFFYPQPGIQQIGSRQGLADLVEQLPVRGRFCCQPAPQAAFGEVQAARDLGLAGQFAGLLEQRMASNCASQPKTERYCSRCSGAGYARQMPASAWR